MGKPVVMGRKTYLSIGKPLKGRTTIVVSRDRAFAAPGIVVAPSLDYALAAARGDALRRGADAIIVAGGADIYTQALPLAVAARHHRSAQARRGRRVLSRQSIATIWREVARSEQQPAADDEAAFCLCQLRARQCGGKAPPSAA